MPGYIDPKFRDGELDPPKTWGGIIKFVFAAIAIIFAAGVAVVGYVLHVINQQTNYSPF